MTRIDVGSVFAITGEYPLTGKRPTRLTRYFMVTSLVDHMYKLLQLEWTTDNMLDKTLTTFRDSQGYVGELVPNSKFTVLWDHKSNRQFIGQTSAFQIKTS